MLSFKIGIKKIFNEQYAALRMNSLHYMTKVYTNTFQPNFIFECYIG